MEPVLLTDLISATRGDARGLSGTTPMVRRISIDSRTLQQGDLYWALSGKNHDGHDFVDAARRRGAIACVVARSRAEKTEGNLVAVDDTLAALADFARWYRLQRETMVIGVTGSVGKTTTREMIHAVLSARHAGKQSQQNYNNEVGLPLSLLELGDDDDFGVLEMGASRIGDIKQLCDIACPEVGVLTRIGPAHLESFGSLDNIYEAKGELLESLPAGGFAVVPGDDELMRRMAHRAKCPVIHVGEGSGNTIRARNVSFTPGRLQFQIEQCVYELAVPARHFLTAALCAVGVAKEIGMEAAAIAEGFRNFTGAPGRCHVEQIGNWTLIDDTYNASPLSMQAACLCLRDWPTAGNRLLVAGDMLELGHDSDRCHEELGACIAETRIDRLLAFGRQADHVAHGALRAGMKSHTIADCHDLDSLLTVLDCWLAPGDVILVKGSRGMRMERVIQWLRQHEHGAGPRTHLAARAVA